MIVTNIYTNIHPTNNKEMKTWWHNKHNKPTNIIKHRDDDNIQRNGFNDLHQPASQAKNPHSGSTTLTWPINRHRSQCHYPDGDGNGWFSLEISLRFQDINAFQVGDIWRWKWKWKSHVHQSFNQPTSSFSFQVKNDTKKTTLGKSFWETDGLFKGWIRHTEVCWIQTFVNNCFFGSCIKVGLFSPNVCLNSTFCWFLNKRQGSLEFPCLFLCFF